MKTDKMYHTVCITKTGNGKPLPTLFYGREDKLDFFYAHTEETAWSFYTLHPMDSTGGKFRRVRQTESTFAATMFVKVTLQLQQVFIPKRQEASFLCAFQNDKQI